MSHVMVHAVTLLLLAVGSAGMQLNSNDRNGNHDQKKGYATSLGKVVKVKEAEWTQLGIMNEHGVTRYSNLAIKANSTSGHWWPDASGQRGTDYEGPTDLADSVIWGWHHPNGIYNTMPVGGPVIDHDQNIYLGSDDAIRKFSPSGDLLWIYGPRGQLAAQPSLAITGTKARREGDDLSFLDDVLEDALGPKHSAEGKDGLKPDWASNHTSSPASDFAPVNSKQVLLQVDKAAADLLSWGDEIKVGDKVRVRPGKGFSANGRVVYKSGDVGQVSTIVPDGPETWAVIKWHDPGHETVSKLSALDRRFARIEETPRTKSMPAALVGSTTSGFVFAIDLEKGEEMWATQASIQIAGVKGAVGAKDGVVVVATNRCTDRYCYKYRYLVNALMPGNTLVRGLSLKTGSPLWEYKTASPVWNMLPQWGKDGTVLFTDGEGTAYCLDLQTGKEIWKKEGNMGTNTQAAGVYFEPLNMFISLGTAQYTGDDCNPYTKRGIKHTCGARPGSEGVVWAYDGTSGRLLWTATTPEPPAGVAIAPTATNVPKHTRVIVTMGFNCRYNSPSGIYVYSPDSGDLRWRRDGPTLWSQACAGDKEGADVRRAMGARSTCMPNSMTIPAVDKRGDIYVGTQVGELIRWGSKAGRHPPVDILSSLSTVSGFTDNSIAFGDGFMVASTCSSLIVFKTPS